MLFHIRRPKVDQHAAERQQRQPDAAVVQLALHPEEHVDVACQPIRPGDHQQVADGQRRQARLQLRLAGSGAIVTEDVGRRVRPFVQQPLLLLEDGWRSTGRSSDVAYRDGYGGFDRSERGDGAPLLPAPCFCSSASWRHRRDEPQAQLKRTKPKAEWLANLDPLGTSLSH